MNKTLEERLAKLERAKAEMLKVGDVVIRNTRVEMDWTDDGARCFSTKEGFSCPRCGVPITPNVEHRCGNLAEV